MEITSRECIDVKVVPDLLQFIALRARLEDLDGLPVININDVPLQGFNAWLKRATRHRAVGGGAASCWRSRRRHRARSCKLDVAGTGVLPPGAHGPRRQARSPSTSSDRCTQDAEDAHRPGLGARRRPARDAGRAAGCAGSTSTSCRSSGTCCSGDMSIVGPRPERPFFVEQFKHRIPQYMLRHKVKAGITGWAQVNGWRGNTSLEKRIEYDLYYIENWSVTLDLKIMWLTLVRGLFQRSLTAVSAEPSMPRIVVTGAAGFIGSHLSEALLDRGHSVVGIDNLLHRRHRQHRAPARPRLRVHPPRRHAATSTSTGRSTACCTGRARRARSTTSSCRSRR